MSVFRSIVEKVRALKPGQCIEISRDELEHERVALPGWSNADWVLESIIGSAYEYDHYERHETRAVVFRRAAEPASGRFRTYVSPDRRHYFQNIGMGLWELKPEDPAP